MTVSSSSVVCGEWLIIIFAVVEDTVDHLLEKLDFPEHFDDGRALALILCIDFLSIWLVFLYYL